jgi:hypothetical protein
MERVYSAESSSGVASAPLFDCAFDVQADAITSNTASIAVDRKFFINILVFTICGCKITKKKRICYYLCLKILLFRRFELFLHLMFSMLRRRRNIVDRELRKPNTKL